MMCPLSLATLLFSQTDVSSLESDFCNALGTKHAKGIERV